MDALRAIGCGLIEANTAICLSRWRDGEQPDLILLDPGIPSVDAFAAMQALRDDVAPPESA